MARKQNKWHILVPSSDPPSSLRKPQMSLNAYFDQKWQGTAAFECI
ncbi:uncharacterized protein ARMOST_07016 [Armillaria ostoyae]|uniref:Uncharacterized protein n=1 Tax=Armillaria ostoyae TaxID=47428 RepID=A0A284R4L6_ARMOS|nr:uncharacterized protein ARMOST_07016 [Armillaria ostoyae]